MIGIVAISLLIGCGLGYLWGKGEEQRERMKEMVANRIWLEEHWARIKAKATIEELLTDIEDRKAALDD